MFLHPNRAFDSILKHNYFLRYGLIALLIPAVGYTLFYAMAYSAGGAPSTFKPWLALPIEKYFFYDIFLTVPGYFISFLVAGGVVHLVSKLFNGKGSYEATLTVLGFGIGVASWSAMIHDLPDAILGFVGMIDMKAYEQALNSPTIWRTIWMILYGGYFIWFPILFAKGISLSQKIPIMNAIPIAITGFISFQTVLLIFIR